jgi:hypothetical protein
MRLLSLLLLAALSTVAAADDILGQGEFRYRVVPNCGREALAQGRLFYLTDDARACHCPYSSNLTLS